MRIASADIESNNWIDFLMLGFFDGKNYKVFSSVKRFLDFILVKKNNGLRIYFHNGGRFDFIFLLDELFKRGKVEFVERTGGLILIKFRTKKVYIEFADSYCLLPASLEKLIEINGINHKKIKIDFTKKYKFNDERLQRHLKNDVLALFEIVQRFYKKEGTLSLTVASHSLKVFTSKFCKLDFFQCDDDFDNYFRTNFYKGGRVEVYKGYGKNLYYYDINSLYPFVMLNEMPSGMPVRTKKFIRDKIGFYKIELNEDTHFDISVLTVKKFFNNYYVNGMKGDKFYLHSCELEYLKEKKISFKIIDGYYFEQSEDLFTDFVNYFYNEKKNAKNSFDRYFAKLILNSLYGKFGQKIKGEKLVVNDGRYNDYKIFDAYNDLILVDKNFNVKFKCVYVASYITALARTYHLRLMDKVGFENIFYCDTDSIICSKKLKTSDEIGELKLEAEIKEGIFLMPKVYGYIDKKGNEVVKYKGFRERSFSYQSLKELLNGQRKELVVKERKMLSMRASVRRKKDIIKSNGKFLKTVDIEKKLSFDYKRRQVIKDKKYVFVTKPFNSLMLNEM